jgi:hypothetical protein
MRAPRREMPMGARREALEAARRIKLSPLLSRPDLDALERGLDLLDELCGPQKPRSPLDRPQIGPAEVKELTELLPELTKLHGNRDPLLMHFTKAWREEARSHSEMALRLRTAFACGYLPVDPPTKDGPGIAWDVRDLSILEGVLAALPQQLKKLGSIRLVRMLPTLPDSKDLNDLKDAWRATPDALKQNVTGKIAKVKNALRVRLVEETAPAPSDGMTAVKAVHLPGELLAVSKLRGLRGTAALGIIYALAEEHYRVDPREKDLFDQKLDRAIRRERMAEDPARAYALATAAFALAPGLLEEKYPKTHNHMLDRFDTSLASYDGGALMRPAVEALLVLR